jgi:hypothetical protein
VRTDLSRRDFLRSTSTIGVSGAIAWSMPVVRSVRLAPNAGSPPPPTDTVIEQGTTAPPAPVGKATTTTTSVPPADDPRRTGADSGDSTLPMTGSETRRTAAVGVGAVAVGRALMFARRTDRT